MQYNVEGADSNTGEDRVVQVEAESQRAAETAARALGVLASAVYPATTRNEHEALDELAAAQTKRVAEYRTPSTPAAAALPRRPAPPNYLGLSIGGLVLRVFAALYYVLAIGAMGLVAVISIWGTRSIRDLPVAGLTMLTGFMYAVTFGMIGGILHALGEGCTALRDIARNSWR